MATDKFVRRSKLRHYASRIARENRSVSTVAFEGVCAGGRSRNAKETEGWMGERLFKNPQGKTKPTSTRYPVKVFLLFFSWG